MINCLLELYSISNFRKVVFINKFPIKISRLITLIALFHFIAILPIYSFDNVGLQDQKIHLALRRTAHLLLLESKDTSSQIVPAEKLADYIWQLNFPKSFNYDRLPTILQSSFDLHDINDQYNVAVLSCDSNELVLGYHFLDFVQNKNVPCLGRQMTVDCYTLRVTFLPAQMVTSFGMYTPILFGFIGLILLLLLYQLWYKPRNRAFKQENYHFDWIHFSASKLDVTNQILLCNDKKHTLTYREAKLLHLFVQNSNQVIERDYIVDNVWADEGVIVSRSVDVFVSRLRKILRDDSAIQLLSVHGIGYRMEIS